MSDSTDKNKKFLYLDSKPRLLLILFFISSLIWVLITPLGASPDEGSHVQYAKVVISGKYNEVKNSNFKVELPENIATINEKELCYYQNVSSPGDCYIDIDQNKTSPFTISLRVPGYPPFYYAVTGLPLLFGFSNEIWYLMRIVSVLLSTFIFGFTLYKVKDFIDSNIVYGILLAITPMLSFLVGSVTPSSMEIVSGVSLSLLLLLYPQMFKSNSWQISHTVTVILISLLLISARPFSGVMFLSIITCILARHVKKINPYQFIALLASIVFSGLIGIIYILKSGINLPGFFLPPALPHQIIEAQFSKLDNYLYDSVGYFAWIMSYRGLELIHLLWVGMILLLIVWSFQYFDKPERASLFLITFASLVFIPLAVYYFFFKAGFGYQARYAMPLICSIPLFAVVGRDRNLNIPTNQIVFLTYFVPFAYFSYWIISGYRNSFGLPFQILSWQNKDFSVWLNPFALLITVFLFASYFYLSKKLIHNIKSNFNNLTVKESF